MKQSAILRFVTCTAIVLSAVACMSNTHYSGRAISDDKVSQLIKGKTTVDDVIALFGAPQASSEMAGVILYTYRYEQAKQDMGFFPYYSRGTGKTTSDELTISFDKATGMVKTHSLQRGIGTKA